MSDTAHHLANISIISVMNVHLTYGVCCFICIPSLSGVIFKNRNQIPPAPLLALSLLTHYAWPPLHPAGSSAPGTMPKLFPRLGAHCPQSCTCWTPLCHAGDNASVTSLERPSLLWHSLFLSPRGRESTAS